MVALSSTPNLEKLVSAKLEYSFENMNEDTQAAYDDFKARATSLEVLEIWDAINY